MHIHKQKNLQHFVNTSILSPPCTTLTQLIIKITFMKALLYSALVLCFATTSAYSKENNTTQLLTQTVTAESAHLTTRIQWIKFPKIQFDDAELKSQDRYAIVRIKADESGKVIDAAVKESTGVVKLDQMLLKAVYAAQTKPLQKNGNALSMIGYQAFSLKLNEDDRENCKLSFNSKVWHAQQQQQKAAFTYVKAPELSISANDLNGHDRTMKFTLKVDKHGHMKKAKITQGSGVYTLDQVLKQSLLTAQVKVPRQYWIYKKSTLKDEIQLHLDQCKP